MSTSFQDVIDAWDRDGATGGDSIHPLPVDSAEWWALGETQAAQVADYAVPGDVVVDYGCGYGRLSIPLAHAGYDLFAVDASQAMLEGVHERASAFDTPSFTAIRSDGTDLHEYFPNRNVDVVIARAVLIHHDYAGVEAIVGALAGILRRGGVLIADWPIAADGEEPRERRGWIDVTTWGRRERHRVATIAGLEPVPTLIAEPSVWRKV